MISLLELNESAFENENINYLKKSANPQTGQVQSRIPEKGPGRLTPAG